MNDKRTDLCRRLVGRVQVVRDGKDHSQSASRCMVEGDDGKTQCVGYYTVILDYNPKTDTFGVEYNGRVPTSQVDLVAIHDTLTKLLSIL